MKLKHKKHKQLKKHKQKQEGKSDTGRELLGAVYDRERMNGSSMRATGQKRMRMRTEKRTETGGSVSSASEEV